MKRTWSVAAAAAAIVAATIISADHGWSPDLSRYAGHSAVVADRDHHILRAFTTGDGKWRLPSRAADVDPRYLELLRAYEDKRFDQHWGVDPLALARAAMQWARAGRIVSGGSTLTMQVARLLSAPHPRGVGTKIVQIGRALQLEARYRKDDILAMYLTLAPFGGNLEGVRAASLAYFGKEPALLTLGQAALLVALPQSPERLRPDRHPSAARAGRDKVLARLRAEGIITARDEAEARAEPVPDRRLALPFAAPHLAEHLVATATSHEAEIGTWIDGDLQRAAELLTRDEARWFGDGAGMAAIMVDNATRHVIVYIGGVDFFGRRAGQLDLARRLRSPGSALKPFIYGMAFDDGAIHPATLIDDEPTRFGDYAPKDFDRDYRGTVSVREALADSLNVPAVALLERVGPMRFVADLRQGGARLSTQRLVGMPSLPVALGGVGISLADLTMLYVDLANGGVAGPLIYAGATPPTAPRQLMSPTAAWYVGDILAGSARPDGWGQGIGLTSSRSIAFKTGTSYGFRDAWAVGFSPAYTVGVWIGRADGSPRPGHFGRNTATPIMLKLFGLLPAEAPGWRAPPPNALLARGNEALPPALRHFTREGEEHGPHRAPPRILFPADGMLIETTRAEPEIVLKAKGGRGDLYWIVNGKPLGRPRLGADMFWQPDSEGFARIAVIDADGNRAAVRVRVKLQR